MTKIPSRRHVVTAMQRMTTSSGTNIPRAADETSVARTGHMHTTRASKPVATDARCSPLAHTANYTCSCERTSREIGTGKKERREESAQGQDTEREEAPEVVAGRFEPGALLRRQY